MKFNEKAQMVLNQLRMFKTVPNSVVIGLQPNSTRIEEEVGKTITLDILPDSLSFVSGTSKAGKPYAATKIDAIYNEKPIALSLNERVLEKLQDGQEINQVFVTIVQNGIYKNFSLGYLTEVESAEAYQSLMEYRAKQIVKELATK